MLMILIIHVATFSLHAYPSKGMQKVQTKYYYYPGFSPAALLKVLQFYWIQFYQVPIYYTLIESGKCIDTSQRKNEFLS